MNRRDVLKTAGAAAALSGLGVAPARANSPAAQDIVDNAAVAAHQMRHGQHAAQINFLLKHCSGAMVFPSLLKGGFILGGEGGSGVLMGRADAGWSHPAFYTTGNASIGLQAGVQDTRVMIIIMNDQALSRALDHDFKLGADMSVAAGPEGEDVELSSRNLLYDMYFFAENIQGVYLGVNLEGGVIAKRDDYNRAYYNANEATPWGVVLDRRFANPGASQLIATFGAAV